MKLFGFDITRGEQRASPEDPRVPVSASALLSFFGVGSDVSLPAVTVDNALRVPAVWAAVNFLSRTLASLSKHPYRVTEKGPVKITGKLGIIVHEAPNDEMGAFKFWQYFWSQVFTGGRGLAWIERNGTGIEALWLIDPTKATIKRNGVKLAYVVDGQTYPAADIIDVPFLLKPNQTQHYGPIAMAAKAIQLALAMNDYGSKFFAGGGVPPLALVGPMPQGAEALKRAMADVQRAVAAAKDSDTPVFPMPPGHELKPVGFDPEKGQMTDARRFQIEEFGRVYQLPPVFLQDLTHGTFSNTEQQDLHLVKHLVSQWARALEDELNLKFFGRLNASRYIEHNLDSLQRGDFKSRIEGIAQAIQGGFMEPNRGRALMNWPAHDNPNADDLFLQGATVPLGSQPGSEPVPPEPAHSPDDMPADDTGDAQNV